MLSGGSTFWGGGAGLPRLAWHGMRSPGSLMCFCASLCARGCARLSEFLAPVIYLWQGGFIFGVGAGGRWELGKMNSIPFEQP